MNDLYGEIILELNRNPLNKKVLVDFDVESREFNPVCGDEITVRLKTEGGVVTDVGHQGAGCAISTAAASVVTDDIKGKTLSQISQMTLRDVTDLLGVDIIETRVQCALLGLKAIQSGIRNQEPRMAVNVLP